MTGVVLGCANLGHILEIADVLTKDHVDQQRSNFNHRRCVVPI